MCGIFLGGNYLVTTWQCICDAVFCLRTPHSSSRWWSPPAVRFSQSKVVCKYSCRNYLEDEYSKHPGWSTFLSDCNSTLLQLDLSHVCILHLLPLVVVSHLWNVRLLWSCLTWSKTTKQTHWFVKRKIVPTFLLKKSSLHLSLWWKTLWYYHNDFHPKGIKLC